MTLAEIRTQVQDILGPGAFYSTAEINSMINRLYRIYAGLTLAIERQGSIVISPAVNSFSPCLNFPGHVVPYRLAIAGRRVRKASLAALEAMAADWFIKQGNDVTHYAVAGGNRIFLYPSPYVSKTLDFSYAALGSDLFDASVPEIPVHHHISLAHGAAGVLRLAKEGGQEGEKARPYLKSFLEAVSSQAAEMRKRAQIQGWDTMPLPVDMKSLKTILTEAA